MDVRLQKILSGAGVASRRAAEQLMRDGRVSVNGTTILDPGAKADPERDDIRVDGSRVKGRERARYLLVSELAMAKNCEEANVEVLLAKTLSKTNLRFPGSMPKGTVSYEIRLIDETGLESNPSIQMVTLK